MGSPDSPDALREHVDRLEADLKTLGADHLRLRLELQEAQSRLAAERASAYRVQRRLETQLAAVEAERRLERESMIEWLARRYKQQEQAMLARNISSETKRAMEFEIALINRLRETLIEGQHLITGADPLKIPARKQR